MGMHTSLYSTSLQVIVLPLHGLYVIELIFFLLITGSLKDLLSNKQRLEPRTYQSAIERKLAMFIDFIFIVNCFNKICH